LAKVSNEIARQAAMIGYLNAFTMYTVTSGLAVALVLMVRRRRDSSAKPTRGEPAKAPERQRQLSGT
jgi:hypothetical protein